ncbi:CDP-glycerol glycerophosphotransferase family protein [Thalassotalea crassostreae]|uniref:CDP-glycerol glycerophosphotransferase family protein n=1 Tax=Thalassotalea crassostreae TaxID=1763536 RepID=UPI000AC074CD|nr:CDP-glycerol glycerophosphotransferase family protein [Thalassotalea crassostreae]
MTMTKKYILYITKNYGFSILRPLQNAILARGGTVCWFAPGGKVDHSYFEKEDKVLTEVEELIKFQPDAKFFPSNNAPTFLPGINVAIFHGFDAGKLDKKGNNDHFKDRNCFDLFCTQGPYLTKNFEALHKSPPQFQVTETGWCALDDLFPATLPKNEKPTILLCSTFSKYLTCAPHLFSTIKQLSQKGDWHWLIQFHPKMNKETIEKYKSIQSENLEFCDTSDTNPLLKRADVMVCDTSSILISFLLLRKPVVTFKNINPGPHLIDIDDPELLEQSIQTALTRPQSLLTHIDKFISDNHPYDDGKSSYRVLDAVDLYYQNKDKFAPKKLDIIRQFKMRKSLNYWKF